MCQNRLLLLDRADLILTSQILHRDGRQVRTVAMLARIVDSGTRTASRPDDSALLPITDRTGRQISPGLSMQLGQGLRQILCVYQLVRRILQLHLPAVRRRWWWRDEE